MPFFDNLGRPLAEADIQAAIPYGINDEDAEGETPSFGQTLSANYRINNEIVSAIQSHRFGTAAAAGPIDPLFNPWTLIENTPYEEHWGRFTEARNATDLENIKADIDDETREREVIGRSGFLANLAAGGLATLTSPLTLVPASAPIRGAQIGFSTVKAALMTGALTMGTVTAQEALLHASQQTRELDESAFNVFTAGVVGTVLGGVFAKVLTRAEIDGLSRKIIRDLQTPPSSPPEATAMSEAMDAINRALPDEQVVPSPQPTSGGSAATPIPHIDDLEIAGSTAKALVKAAQLNPNARALFYSSAVARSVMFRLGENSIYLAGAALGRTPGATAENLINHWSRGVMGLATKSHVDVYRTFRKGGGRMTRSEFNAEVGRALQEGDVHIDPFVTQAAKLWRSQVFEPLTKAAINAGFLPEDVTRSTAVSYFTRVWNRKKLRAEEFKTREGLPGFKPTVKNYFRPLVAKDKFDTNAEFESYIDEIADTVFDKLTGRGGEFGFDFQKITVSARGPLKERTFNIPDAVIRQWLDMDVERVAGRYTRIMAADIEIANRFPESIDQGTKRVTLHGPLRKIEEDYKKLREEVAADPNLPETARAKRLATLNDEEDRVIEDIEAVRDLLRGTYGQDRESTTFARVLRVAGQFNFMRMMGGVVPSSGPDVLRPMFVHGVRDYFEVIGKLATDPQFRAISKREAMLAGNLGETALAARMASWGDMVDPYLSDSPFERFMGNATRVFARASGIGLWNDWMKLFASAHMENRIVRNLMKDYDSLPADEKFYMSHLYIDKDMAERMRAQIEASPGGGQKDGFWHSGTEKWTDEEAKRTFWAGLNKDVNSLIVTPGAGDLPLIMRKYPSVRSAMQFKSYVIASHQKALVRATQDARHGNGVGVLMALLGSISVGMFISWMRAIETNRVEDLSSNPGTWIAEGIDRSGVFSLLMEANNSVERIWPGKGLYGLLEAPFDEPGTGGAARFGFRPPSSIIAGPTGSTADDLYRVFRNGDEQRLWTLLPGRTLPYVRPILEWGVKPSLSANE